MERDVVVAGELDRAQGQHLDAGAGHLEHLVEVDARQLAGLRHDARVGGEHAGDVGVDLARVGAERRGERRRGGVATPPRPSVVISWSVLTPWKPATTRTLPAASASRTRSPLTSRILALLCIVSVMMPTWLPVKLTASMPRSASAMVSSAAD